MAGPRRAIRPRTGWVSIWNGATMSSSDRVMSERIWVLGSQSSGHHPETPGQNRLLSVDAVLGFVPDQRAGAIDNARRHLLAAMRRQAVQKHRVWQGEIHQGLAHLEGCERRNPRLVIGVAHRDPG